MKKIIFVSALVFASGIFAKAQSSQLDGKQFTIELFINKEKDSTDTLYFENGTMRSATQKKYGFTITNFKTKEKNGIITFDANFKSKKNGEEIWEGKVKDDEVEGTLIWDKELVNPVNYTFKKKREIK